jgi:molybdenum cofactor biosynthesis enzyme MoaA
MQYYSNPYHAEIQKVLYSIKALVKASDGIDCLRLIGGEPLLWPDLAKLISYAIAEVKIKGILIVTNGTLTITAK